MTVFWGALFVILLGLGTWQIQRLHWKEGLIAQRQTAIHAPPTALPATEAQARELEFHHVKLDGAFQNQGELYLHAISKRGKPGFHVITPFALADGRTIFIDRGFVPEDKRDPATRAAGQQSGKVTLTGLLRVTGEQSSSWFLPANDAAKNSWFSLDLAAMAKADGIAGALPFYVDADAGQAPGGLPQGGQTYTDLPNDHLQYALTWYGLAALVPIYYLLIVIRLLKDRKAREA